jgi:hypothetical protein
MPLFVTPNRKLSVSDVMDLMRSHGEGTWFDNTGVCAFTIITLMYDLSYSGTLRADVGATAGLFFLINNRLQKSFSYRIQQLHQALQLPLETANLDAGPRHVFERAHRRRAADGLKNPADPSHFHLPRKAWTFVATGRSWLPAPIQVQLIIPSTVAPAQRLCVRIQVLESYVSMQAQMWWAPDDSSTALRIPLYVCACISMHVECLHGSVSFCVATSIIILTPCCLDKVGWSPSRARGLCRYGDN